MEPVVRKAKSPRTASGPLPRERSLKSIQAFTGTAEKLVNAVDDGTAVDLHRTCGNSPACPIHQVLHYYLLVEKCVPVWHGPRGCTDVTAVVNIFRNGHELQAGRMPTAWETVSTDLGENEIIYGGEKKLRETILWVDRTYKPEIIPVFATCSPGIIGDDIDNVVREVQKEVNAIVIPHHTEGYRTMVWATAFDICAYAWVHYIMEEPRVKEKDLLNVFLSGTHDRSEDEHIRELLVRVGIRPQFYPKFVSVADIRKAPQAAANVGTCDPQGLGFCEYMKSRFGVPYAQTRAPLGVRQTSRWLMLVAQLLGKEKEMAVLVREEEEKLQEKLKPLLPKLKGKRVYVDAGPGRAFGMIKVCHELGLVPVGAMTYAHDKVCQSGLKEVMDVCGKDFVMQVGPTIPSEEIAMMLQKKVDLVWGSRPLGLYAIKAGIPLIGTLSRRNRGRLGYKGFYETALEMVRLLENPGLARVAARYFNTYSEQWLANQEFYRESIPSAMVRF